MRVRALLTVWWEKQGQCDLTWVREENGTSPCLQRDQILQILIGHAKISHFILIALENQKKKKKKRNLNMETVQSVFYFFNYYGACMKTRFKDI